MSKIVIIEIANCYRCPHYRSNDLGISELEYCDITRKSISETKLGTVPKWCPLPEKKNGMAEGDMD